MSTRSNLLLLALYCANSASATTPLAAQRPETPYVTVMTFQSPDKGLGADVADRIRSKLADDFSQKALFTVPTKDVANFLESSGFNIEDPLLSNDERTLAVSVHADFYITGTVTHLETGYRIEPRIVLSRDATLVQPLPTQTSSELDNAVSDVSKSIRDAMKQLPGEKRCIIEARSNKIPAALKAADEASAEYPKATLSRLCAQSVYYDLYRRAGKHADSLAYSDSALAVAAQVLQHDSLSVQPLKLNVELFRFRGDSTRYRASLLKLASADPNNLKLMEQVANELAGAGHAQEAYPLIKMLLDRSPGDPGILRTALSIYSVTSDWQQIANVGAELARADTAAADTLYFIRMGVAYEQVKDPAKGVEILAQGTAKFPTNGPLWYAYSRALHDAGQEQASDVALRKAATYDPQFRPMLRRFLLPVSALADRKQFDSAYTAIGEGLTKGADSAMGARYALNIGQQIYKAAAATVATDTAAEADKTRSNLQLSIKFLELANQLQPSVDAQFIAGAAAFSILQSAATEASKTNSCSLAQLANDSYTSAQTNLPAGTKDAKYQSGASSMMEYLPKFRAAIDSQLKQFCK